MWTFWCSLDLISIPQHDASHRKMKLGKWSFLIFLAQVLSMNPNPYLLERRHLFSLITWGIRSTNNLWEEWGHDFGLPITAIGQNSNWHCKALQHHGHTGSEVCAEIWINWNEVELTLFNRIHPDREQSGPEAPPGWEFNRLIIHGGVEQEYRYVFIPIQGLIAATGRKV